MTNSSGHLRLGGKRKIPSDGNYLAFSNLPWQIVKFSPMNFFFFNINCALSTVLTTRPDNWGGGGNHSCGTYSLAKQTDIKSIISIVIRIMFSLSTSQRDLVLSKRQGRPLWRSDILS